MPKTMRIPDSAVDRAAYVIDSQDVTGKFAAAMGFSARGRPRTLPFRSFLIGGLLAVQWEGEFKATVIHRVLTEGLSYAKQRELGVRYPDKNGDMQVINTGKLYSLTRRMDERMAYGRLSAPDLDEAERERRRQALQDLIDAILDGSLIGKGTGWYALDASGLWGWSKKPYRKTEDVPDVRRTDDDSPEPEQTPDTGVPASPTDDQHADESATEGDPAAEDGTSTADDSSKRRKRSEPTYDVDAAVGYKTAKFGERETFFGFLLDAAVRVTPPGEGSAPMVAERIVVSPANADCVEPSLTMLDSIIAKGTRVTDICVDRDYSYKKVERWASELRRRRINQHLDLRSGEQGFRDYNGLKVAAGWMHCPATPFELGHIPRPGPNATEKARKEFRRNIDKRQSYAMARIERTNGDGRARWQCPALEGRIGCPLREGTVEAARAGGLPIVDNPPDIEHAPKCCTNSGGTVATRYEKQQKHEQPHYWGSHEWKAAYDRRTFVEGFFGSLKNPDAEDLHRGSTRFTGLPKVSLSVAFAVAATNIRHQRKWWAKRDGKPDHPLLSEDPPSLGWTELTQEQLDALDRDAR